MHKGDGCTVFHICPKVISLLSVRCLHGVYNMNWPLTLMLQYSFNEDQMSGRSKSRGFFFAVAAAFSPLHGFPVQSPGDRMLLTSY